MNYHNHNYPLTYALNEQDKMVSVKSVERGSKCRCRCPLCGEPLDAKKGYGGHKPHFAHQSGKECKGAYMSALHLLAEQIIENNKALMAPGFKNIIGPRKMEFVKAPKEGQEEWKKIKPEEWGNIKPDVIGVTADDKKWAIEIFYTNEVDDSKKQKIIDFGISCLEIDVREQSLEGLEHFILNSANDRWWINNPNDEQMIHEEYGIDDKVEVDYCSFPPNCNSLKEYNDYLLNNRYFVWKGITHYATEIELSPNHNELLVVHYNDSRKWPPYHITVFYFIDDKLKTETKTDNHKKIMEYFTAKKQEWEG